MNNHSSHLFTDISSEAFRQYHFPDGSRVEINYPTHLSVSKSGGHRLFDRAGNSHYVPSGWIHLMWRARDGHANFVA